MHLGKDGVLPRCFFWVPCNTYACHIETIYLSIHLLVIFIIVGKCNKIFNWPNKLPNWFVIFRHKSNHQIILAWHSFRKNPQTRASGFEGYLKQGRVFYSPIRLLFICIICMSTLKPPSFFEGGGLWWFWKSPLKQPDLLSETPGRGNKWRPPGFGGRNWIFWGKWVAKMDGSILESRKYWPHNSNDKWYIQSKLRILPKWKIIDCIARIPHLVEDPQYLVSGRF